MDDKQNVKTAPENGGATSASSGRDIKGRFAKGNQIAGEASIIGVSSLSIRRHRAFINEHTPQLLQILLDEAITNKNIQVAMWLVGKIIPDTKSATFAHSQLLNSINTLGELKDQASRTIQESLQGESSLEETNMLMGIYKEHKNLIEAADIEPLAQELAKRMGRV